MNSGSTGIRSFIAVKLPRQVTHVLSELQSQLRSRSRTEVKWVETENLHLTLKFLGDISVGQVSPIAEMIRQSVRDASPLHADLNGLGAFPDLRLVKIVWAGLAGDMASLALLQRRIDAGLEPMGFPREIRAFTPHLTIGRVRETASLLERQSLGVAIQSVQAGSGHGFIIDRVYLVKSVLTPRGPVYSNLAEINLD